MATTAANYSSCNLVHVGTLELEYEAGRDPEYTGLVVLPSDMVMVVDYEASNLRLHSLKDGHLLASYDRLVSSPQDICICNIHDNQIQMAVTLHKGQIEILSIKFTDQTPTITRMWTLNVKRRFDECQGVKYLNETLLISGQKQDNMCWGIVSLTDEHVDTVHKICECGKISWSYLSTNPRDDNMVYISCNADRHNTGVYGYSSSKREFLYQHDDLKNPTGITVDTRGFIFVCNWYPTCIHQLTKKGQLMTIYREGLPSLPRAIFWEEQQGHLYLTSEGNVITIYTPVYSDQQDTATIPAEILRMNDRSIQLFKEALKHGEERIYNIRVMVVGHLGVGKTTLIKRLLGEEVNIEDRQSTEGIIVHVHCCRVSRDTLKWTSNEGDSEQNMRLQRLAKILNDKLHKTNSTGKQEEEEVILPKEIIYPCEKKDYTGNKDTTGDHDLHLQDVGQDIPSFSAADKFPSNQIKNLDVKDTESATVKVSDDPAVEILKLLHDKADKLTQETDESIPLTMVDFAGQYAFYTTHQTFLTERAIYILVSNISEQVTDAVKDDCYFDMEGIKLCKVYELVEVWLNSIHSCAPSPEAGTPPVILVGTHVDTIQQEFRKELCEDYFRHIRLEYFGGKPTRFHLADEDFAIDNSVIDQKLDDLKKKIVQLASKQPYWGEVIPARWLPLEERLMSLKAGNVKVIPYSLLEKMNQEGAVKIESREELDLFLRFQHDIGNILYFGTEDLKEQIMLDPQWLIYALRTLITAEDFILRKMPAVIEKWRQFKKTGKLTQELIDAIWTKENNPDCHENKELILHLMEKLNIIARPRSFNKAGDEIKVENYFIVPCMLSETTPRDIISPAPHPQKESSSVLCYVFTGRFLPAPIFHRLLAACVTQWSIAKKKSDNLIFCGCGVFDVKDCHKLTLHFKGYVIYARVTKMSLKNKTPDSEVCIQVKEFIDLNLSKIIGYLCQNLKFEWYIQCPQSETNCLDSMFPVSRLQAIQELSCSSHDDDHPVMSQDLLKFWFKDKNKEDRQQQLHMKRESFFSEEDQEEEFHDAAATPITQENINHARLCNVLITVCANALRKILLTQVPAPHINIYQAILVNQANLTSRRQVKPGQWQSALLNKVQSQLVFPDPQGCYTATVDQFDISLLYTMIRNISSVTAPTTGWGNPPSDKPRDTTLGSSVERIRLYRNSISGHSVDGKISQQDFEYYWNMIDKVLHDIENVIGNQGYLEDLEKRKNQIITPHEACELRRTFQKYMKQTEDAAADIQSALETALSAVKDLTGHKN